MASRILKVTFEATAQKNDDGKLTVPKNVVEALKLGSKKEIHLEIWSGSGFTSGDYTMASGTEVYETGGRNLGLRRAVKRGERLLITASRPA